MLKDKYHQFFPFHVTCIVLCMFDLRCLTFMKLFAFWIIVVLCFCILCFVLAPLVLLLIFSAFWPFKKNIEISNPKNVVIFILQQIFFSVLVVVTWNFVVADLLYFSSVFVINCSGRILKVSLCRYRFGYTKVLHNYLCVSCVGI